VGIRLSCNWHIADTIKSFDRCFHSVARSRAACRRLLRLCRMCQRWHPMSTTLLDLLSVRCMAMHVLHDMTRIHMTGAVEDPTHIVLTWSDLRKQAPPIDFLAVECGHHVMMILRTHCTPRSTTRLVTGCLSNEESSGLGLLVTKITIGHKTTWGHFSRSPAGPAVRCSVLQNFQNF